MATLKDISRAREAEERPDIPESGLGLLLREAFMSYGRNFRAALGEYGITYSQWRHLWLLLRDGPLTPVELSDRAGLKKASSTAIIQTLVEQNLIQRERDAKDRRKVNLSLTDEGIELIKRLSLSGRIINKHARNDVSDRDYAVTLKTLRRMVENLDRLNSETEQDVLLKLICPKVPKR